jgi:riboflavin synthase
MFTGLITDLGTIDRVQTTDAGREFRIRTSFRDLTAGESIAVSGACLTVREFGEGWFTVAAVLTTLGRTTMADWQAGRRVNLERSLAAGDRLGGHMVQGHVDGVGRIVARTPGEHWEVVRIALPPALARYVVEKGSIAVDGVSLTVSALSPADQPEPWFEVSLIPTTLRDTTLGARTPGDPVNLEVDVIAKYVERLLEGRS